MDMKKNATGINWKVRLKSKNFYIAFTALLGLIVTDLGIMDIGHYEVYVQAILLVLVAGGIIIDPTVEGIRDSEQALEYDKPKKNK